MVKYIHSINLDNWHVCWNLSLKGILISPKLFLKYNPEFVIKNTESLISEITSTPTPTGIIILTNKNQDRVQVEIEFEKIRQEKYSHLPSRFNCLWVAENSESGNKLIENMFNSSEERRTLPVEILPQSKIHKTDKRWYEKYYSNNNKEFIDNYWLGKEYNSKARWEFLVDGGFKISKEAILFLRDIIRKRHVNVLGKGFIEKTYQLHLL